MRPVPSRRHHWALLIVLAVVAANTALSFRQSRITGAQANMLCEALKHNDPALFAGDEVFAADGPWRLNSPIWRRALAAALRLGGRADPLNVLRGAGAVILTLYLLGMYLLVYSQTRSTSVAVLTAAVSMAIFSLNRPYWGVGPIRAVAPSTLYLAVIPLIAMGFIRFRTRWPVVAVFALAGLAGNVHLFSAVNLVAVMLAALLVWGRFRPRVLLAAAAGLAAAAVAAAPAVHHYFTVLHPWGAAWPKMPVPALRDALQLARRNVLYPGVLIELLRWLPAAAALALPAGIILTRRGRYRAANLDGWGCLAGGAMVVAFGVHGLMQWIGRWTGTKPPTLEFFEALRLAMLPLYVLLAQAMLHLLRLARTHRAWVRAALGMFAAVYLGSSHNAKPLRDLVRTGVAALAGQRPPPADARWSELHALARWAADRRNTPRDAMFVTPDAQVRLYARRSLMLCPADVRYLYQLAPDRLGTWTRAPPGRTAEAPAWQVAGEWAPRVRAQRALLRPPDGSPADADRIVAYVDTYWQGRTDRPPAETFVIVRAGAAPAGQSDRLGPVTPPPGRWGTYWRLYRVGPLKPVPPTTASAPAE